MLFRGPAKKPDVESKKKKGVNMVKKLLGAAAMAAVACAFVPVHAAKVGMGCSGDNLAKAEGTVETMADGPAKFTAQREIAQAQDAMLNGRMSGCALHLSRAMRAGALAPASYQQTWGQSPYEGSMAQFAAPGQTVGQAPSQPQAGWKPIQPAQ
jgi:hypothetical protein